MAIVSVVQNLDIQSAVQEAIGLVGGIEKFVRPNDKVVIKPNLVFAIPHDTGFTTSPQVVEAIVELCKSMNPSEIVIAEGSGGDDTNMAFENCGYTEIARKHNIELIDINESQTTMVDVPDSVAFKDLRVSNVILECDALINVSKLKLYKPIPGRPDYATLSVKNLLGVVPGRGEYTDAPSSDFAVELSPQFWSPEGKFFLPHHRQWWNPRGEKERIHTKLADGIVDLNSVITPILNVMDCVTVCNDIYMTHTKGEKAIDLNSIIASRDSLALDWVATKIGGINPLDIKYLRRAAERGIGESDWSNIQVVGTELDNIAQAWKTAFMNKLRF